MGDEGKTTRGRQSKRPKGPRGKRVHQEQRRPEHPTAASRCSWGGSQMADAKQGPNDSPSTPPCCCERLLAGRKAGANGRPERQTSTDGRASGDKLQGDGNDNAAQHNGRGVLFYFISHSS